MSEKYIGVLDSGVGGLSVLKSLRQLLPHENYLYVADSANAPYGPKSREQILSRCRELMGFFTEQQIKVLVLACNTATAAAVAELREEFSIPIVAMEPALKPAAEQTRSGVVGVLATEGTIESDKFVDLKGRFSEQVEFITVPCHGLVESIEKIETDLKSRALLLRRYIEPVLQRGADTLILGCTHYPLIQDEIREVVASLTPSQVELIDTAQAVAAELKRRVLECGISHPKHGELLVGGDVRFYTSGDIKTQCELISLYWGINSVAELLPA